MTIAAKKPLPVEQLPQLLTVRQTSLQLSLCTATVRDLIHQGTLKGVRPTAGRTHWRVTRESLLAYVRSLGA